MSYAERPSNRVEIWSDDGLPSSPQRSEFHSSRVDSAAMGFEHCTWLLCLTGGEQGSALGEIYTVRLLPQGNAGGRRIRKKKNKNKLKLVDADLLLGKDTCSQARARFKSGGGLSTFLSSPSYTLSS
jgi:hypothetical protein